MPDKQSVTSDALLLRAAALSRWENESRDLLLGGIDGLLVPIWTYYVSSMWANEPTIRAWIGTIEATIESNA